MHPAQVLKMALDDRGTNREDRLPELRLHAGRSSRIGSRGAAWNARADWLWPASLQRPRLVMWRRR